ncbi:hypothetical protein [Leifsonia soli]|uniref:Lipoprotein n=1 Tax=Leifsonia soli TaxID=582665 RepID=A0A852T1Z3_9MICO|nr:hypothetical protein [Leifsonia soli]NYD74891.1 hypothetical protein [Leifsonia soli]
MRVFVIVGAAATIVVAALGGCASAGHPSSGASSPAFQGPVPSFTGPWASEFEQAYRSTNSDAVHEILAKGSITDRDYAEVSAEYERCMANKGFPTRVTGPGGEAEIDGGEDSLKADEACNGDFAIIASLRGSILRNPQNLDENEIVVACLVANGVVPQSYTAKEYESNLESQTFPFSIDDAEFTRCARDPLGLSGD